MAKRDTFEGAALAERTPKSTVESLVGEARARLRTEIEACAGYRGGLPMELRSAAQRKLAAVTEARRAARVAVLGGTGRRIDLAALLRRRNQEGQPIWTIADPVTATDREGTFDTDDTIAIGGTWRTIKDIRSPRDKDRKAFQPAGLPPLPPEARTILTDRKIRKRAAWVGVLYQPTEWREVRPDPAVVVEWRDRPGEYFALCVWGGDRAQIMEFVH